nr:hypothetical protein [Tanacetum cinerariifolium]
HKKVPTEWRTHTLIWRNKAYLEDQSLDDLFNNLKIYEAEVKSSSSTSHITQNIAFVSSQNTDSTNESLYMKEKRGKFYKKIGNVNNNDDNCGSSNQNINDMLHDAEHNAEHDMEKLQQLFVESEKPLKWYNDLHTCPVCKVSRYKDTTLMEFDEDVTKNGPAAKVLWYFPIIPRLKQLYSNPKNTKLLRWHAEDQKHDGKMRHVANASQWKKIDNHYTKFRAEIRNIQFGLYSDGINPFGNMSCRHSTWPGPKQPGNDIDVYLESLTDDMIDLWDKGVEVYDAIWNERGEGVVERRKMARLMNGHYTLSGVKDIKTVFGKKDKAPKNNKNIWKKKSIYWKLPYWERLQVLHSLDVMHIEKNVSESLIGLLLNIKGKTKDKINARKDTVEMGIRDELAPQEIGNKRTYFPVACYTLSKAEKNKFCQCLHDIRVPSGYSANIKKLVSMKKLKLIGMKSHDCHVLITQMIPIEVRGILPPQVRHTITKLCLFFNMIHSKVIDLEKLDEWQRDIILTLFQLEMYFPHSFFDVMVHRVSHIVEEIKALGPIFVHYMYPFESKRSIVGVENVVDEDEYNQFDELPLFSIGIQAVDELINFIVQDKHQSIAVMEKPRKKRGINKVKDLPVGESKRREEARACVLKQTNRPRVGAKGFAGFEEQCEEEQCKEEQNDPNKETDLHKIPGRGRNFCLGRRHLNNNGNLTVPLEMAEQIELVKEPIVGTISIWPTTSNIRIDCIKETTTCSLFSPESILIEEKILCAHTSVYHVRDGLIHGKRLRKGYIRVSVLKVLNRKEDLEFLVPDEDILNLGGALNTFIQWPIGAIACFSVLLVYFF